ncbi:hypothetical protein BDK51DRAFT_29596 [Blyttiomyces helicus]|uniref:Uncharacterized protein n=1 Tax=Blyttiomyces helicus TaxID=388810 RepID=A0A4V1ISS0_9FUNG|nr:hypothetical protein BDK51DRAFT_29596 [Blyttiomyces helicus]|eukprot:RKO94527.1 hypothetical protein BDK51DRAFT_29596 [Blyttiomyces helicus]
MRQAEKVRRLRREGRGGKGEVGRERKVSKTPVPTRPFDFHHHDHRQEQQDFVHKAPATSATPTTSSSAPTSTGAWTAPASRPSTFGAATWRPANNAFGGTMTSAAAFGSDPMRVDSGGVREGAGNGTDRFTDTLRASQPSSLKQGMMGAMGWRNGRSDGRLHDGPPWRCLPSWLPLSGFPNHAIPDAESDEEGEGPIPTPVAPWTSNAPANPIGGPFELVHYFIDELKHGVLHMQRVYKSHGYKGGKLPRGLRHPPPTADYTIKSGQNKNKIVRKPKDSWLSLRHFKKSLESIQQNCIIRPPPPIGPCLGSGPTKNENHPPLRRSTTPKSRRMPRKPPIRTARTTSSCAVYAPPGFWLRQEERHRRGHEVSRPPRLPQRAAQERLYKKPTYDSDELLT